MRPERMPWKTFARLGGRLSGPLRIPRSQRSPLAPPRGSNVTQRGARLRRNGTAPLRHRSTVFRPSSALAHRQEREPLRHTAAFPVNRGQYISRISPTAAHSAFTSRVRRGSPKRVSLRYPFIGYPWLFKKGNTAPRAATLLHVSTRPARGRPGVLAAFRGPRPPPPGCTRGAIKLDLWCHPGGFSYSLRRMVDPAWRRRCARLTRPALGAIGCR